MTIRYLIGTICMVLFLWGCDSATEPSAGPKVVRKKIVAEKIQSAKVRTKAPAQNQRPAAGKKPLAGRTSVAAAPVSHLGSTAIPAKYDPAGKIDPFEPLYQDKPVARRTTKRKKRIPQTPLERVDLSQLKLVGIIVAPSGNRALVEEASGKGYVIKKGTYIGTNSGKVVEIKKEKVIVEEEFENVFGKNIARQREIKLPKPPGEF